MALTGSRGDSLRFTPLAADPGRTGSVNNAAGKINSQSVPPRAAGDINGLGKQPLLRTEEQQQQRAQLANNQMSNSNGGGGGGSGSGSGSNEKNKRKQIMTRARKHPTVDRIITVLQDKRVDDDQADQIQDLQLPMLRKVLNVIFIALGVIFLLGVIIVIIYTSLAPMPNYYAIAINATPTTATGASSTNG